MAKGRMLSTRELMTALKISRAYLYKFLLPAGMPSHQMKNKRRRFSIKKIEEWVNSVR